MTTHSKTVILKDTDININSIERKNKKEGRRSYYAPPKGMNVAYKLIDRKNGEIYATFFGSDKPNHKDEIIYTQDINDELSNLSRRLLSDRARTLKNRPQYNIINGRKETLGK